MSLSQVSAIDMMCDNSYYSNFDRDVDLQETYNVLFSKFSELRVTNANNLKKLRLVENDKNCLLKTFDDLKLRISCLVIRLKI
jgi:hypothetical protein